MTAPYPYNQASRLAWAAYTFSVLLIVTPVVDVTTNLWPPSLGLAEWRYGMVGIASNYLLTPILGMLLAGLTAQWQESRGTLRSLAIVCVVAGAVSAAMLLSFGLDVVEVRQAVSIEAMTTFKTGAVKASFKLGTGAVFLLFLGHALWRAGAPPTGTLAEASPADVDWRPQGGAGPAA